MEALEQAYQTVHIVVGTGHEVSTSKVDPRQLREPRSKPLLDVRQRALKHVCPTLAMAMAMKSAHRGRQLLGQVFGHHAKAGTGRTGIVQFGLHL